MSNEVNNKMNGDMIFVVNNIFNHTPAIKQYVKPEDIDDLKQDVYIDILENIHCQLKDAYSIYNMTEFITSSILSRIDAYVQYHKINMLSPGTELLIQKRRNEAIREFILFGEQ